MADEKNITLSPSGLDVFIGCPRKYHYRYTANIHEPEIDQKTSLQWLGPNERGTMIHRAMELYTIACIFPLSHKLGSEDAPPGSVEEDKIVTALNTVIFEEKDFKKAWEQAVKEIEIELQKKSVEALIIPVSAKEKELSEAEVDCRNAIIYLLDKMKERHQYPVEAEMKFGKRKDEDGKELIVSKSGEESFAICGSIDRVDYDVITKKYIVVDYKTGKIDKKRKLREGGRDDLLQDRMYALAFELLNPGKEVSTSRYVFPAEDNQEIVENMTASSKKIFIDRLWDEVNKIRSKVDKCCKGNEAEYPDCEYTCKYCSYNELCIASDELEVLTTDVTG